MKWLYSITISSYHTQPKMFATKFSPSKTPQQTPANTPVEYKSWAQMSFEGDDEEEDPVEVERKRLFEESIKNDVAYRRFLYNIGLYELEEGEILE